MYIDNYSKFLKIVKVSITSKHNDLIEAPVKNKYSSKFFIMFKFRRRIVYKIGAVLFFLTGAMLLLLREPALDRLDTIKTIERAIRSPMNQGQCQHPHLPIDNPEIMKFYYHVEKINCGNILDDWVMCEKSICFVKPEIAASHGEVICSYTDLIRKSDYKVKYGKTTRTQEPYVLEESDFVKVSCGAESGESWTGMALGIRDKVPHRMPQYDAQPAASRVDVASGSLMDEPHFYNVLMFGFDSLSRNAFMRKLPKSYAYLKEHLGAVVLTGYNIVGDGTPQALIPILTGYTEIELPDTRKQAGNGFYVDVYPMVWHDYARHGYVTSFNEDVPNIGTFTYRLNGFAEQPVDHYLRTYYVEAANIWSSSEKNCIGHQPDHIVMLDYTKNFMAKYSDTPRFIFSFHGGLSHDSINLIGAADDDVLNWLTTLKEKHLLDNTILIFMADHGNRFSNVRATLQGKQEERLPFFSFAFPETFKKRFPQQYDTFLKNSDRLITPFDIHATLMDILQLQSSHEQSQQSTQLRESNDASMSSTQENSAAVPVTLSSLASGRAISLFGTIPKNRSCSDAYIEPHWCACLEWEQLPLNDITRTGTLLKMAASIVDSINNATNELRSLCEPLELHRINWAMRLLPHKDLLHFKQTAGNSLDMSDNTSLYEELYQLQIVVNPGESLFEASVTHSLRTFKAVTLLSEVSRVNKYGSQANCIYERNPELRKYCFCRT